MNEIVFTNDSLLAKATENQICKVIKDLADLKEQEKILKESLLREMEKRNIKKIETPKVTITYVDSTTKESFDSKTFRESHRDLYDEFCKISDVKAYVKIGVKNGD